MQVDLTKEQIEALISAVNIASQEGLETDEMLNASNALYSRLNNNQEFIKGFNEWLDFVGYEYRFTGTNPFKDKNAGLDLAKYLTHFAKDLGYDDITELWEAAWQED